MFIPCLLMAGAAPRTFAESEFLQEDDFSFEAVERKMQAVHFYENMAGRYISTMHVYTICDTYALPALPDVSFQWMTGYSRQQLIEKTIDSLLQMMSAYLDKVQHEGMPRTVEIESILVNYVIMLEDNIHQKITGRINEYLWKEYHVKIKYYSEEEQDELLDSDFDIGIFPFGYMEGLSSFPMDLFQPCSDDTLDFIYGQSIRYAAECMIFLKKMKKTDYLFNMNHYYVRKINMELFKFWFTEKFTFGIFKNIQWRPFYQLFSNKMD